MNLECVGTNKTWCERRKEWFYCICDKCIKLNKKEEKNEKSTNRNVIINNIMHNDASTSGER
jgi:hypothetical protein